MFVCLFFGAAFGGVKRARNRFHDDKEKVTVGGSIVTISVSYDANFNFLVNFYKLVTVINSNSKLTTIQMMSSNCTTDFRRKNLFM